MNIKIALTFSTLIVTEIILGYSITSLYDCNINFEYECYRALTLYQLGIIVTNLILLCLCVYQTIFNEILNNTELLNLVHEYIHIHFNECGETKNSLSGSFGGSSKDPLDTHSEEHPDKTSDKPLKNSLDTHSEEHPDKPSNLTKRNIDVDKSINDFNEMIMNLVTDNKINDQLENESK